MEETNWKIAKGNIDIYKSNQQYLFYIKELLINEEIYVTDNLNEGEVYFLNQYSRIRHQIAIKDLPINDVRIILSNKTMHDSTNNQIRILLEKQSLKMTLPNKTTQDR